MTKRSPKRHRRIASEFQGWLLGNFKSSLPRLVLLTALSLASIAILLVTPWPLKILVDSVFGQIPAPGPLGALDQRALLLSVALAYVLIYIASGIIDILDKTLTTNYSLSSARRLKQSFFLHILSLRRTQRQRIQNGDYVYRLNQEVDFLPTLLFSTTTAVIANIITIAASAAVLITLNVQLSVYSLVIIPLLYFSILFFTPRIGKLSRKIELSSSMLYNKSSESIENTEVVQAFNKEEDQADRFASVLHHQNKLEMKMTVLESGFEFSNNLFTSIGVGLIVAIGGMIVIQGGISLGELLIFVTYMSYFYDPLEGLVSGIGTFRSLIAGLKRVHEVLAVKGTEQEAVAGRMLQHPATGRMAFKNVTLRFGDTPILENVNLTIKPGQKVAVIGPSGSGKTSLLSLLMGFVEPDSGSITIDGTDISDLNIHTLRDQMALVSQESVLFAGTIEHNISFGAAATSVSKDKILAAASAANATEFIVRMPNFLKSLVGEDGNQLSGGQRQRLAIARAFLKNAPIILLDEPTSSQDFDSASKIVSATKELMKGKTVLMVTHELSLLKEMDAVFVVTNGKVADVKDYGGIEAYIYQLATHSQAAEE